MQVARPCCSQQEIANSLDVYALTYRGRDGKNRKKQKKYNPKNEKEKDSRISFSSQDQDRLT